MPGLVTCLLKSKAALNIIPLCIAFLYYKDTNTILNTKFI